MTTAHFGLKWELYEFVHLSSFSPLYTFLHNLMWRYRDLKTCRPLFTNLPLGNHRKRFLNNWNYFIWRYYGFFYVVGEQNSYSPRGVLTFMDQGSPGSSVGRALDLWLEGWRFESGMEGPCGTISIFSAPCAVPVFRKRQKTEAPSQSPNGAGSLN